MSFIKKKTSSPTIGDLMRDIVRARRAIFFTTAFFMILAGLFIGLATPYYRAALLVTPANPMSGAEVSSLLANDDLFALRYMVQRVGVTNTSDFTRFESVAVGASTAQALLQDETIMRGLMSEPSWFAAGGTKTWTAYSLSEYLQRRVTFESVGASAMRRIVYWHPNPAFAALFLERVHDIADRHIRTTIRRDATQRIQYLQGAVAKIPNPEHRRALTALLLEQERLRMLVSIDQPYAAEVIEPAAAGSRAAWPKASLVLLMAALAGVMSGFIGWSIWSGVRKTNIDVAQEKTPEKQTKILKPSNTDRPLFRHHDAAE